MYKAEEAKVGDIIFPTENPDLKAKVIAIMPKIIVIGPVEGSGRMSMTYEEFNMKCFKLYITN